MSAERGGYVKLIVAVAETCGYTAHGFSFAVMETMSCVVFFWRWRF